jgi:Protein of unknown function (DUF760)
VQNDSNRNQSFFPNSNESNDGLWQYLQTLSPETISQLSRPHSHEVFQVMERNIISMLGTLPSEHFGVSISTNREHLGKLLASAMIGGYFLRNVEQRMNFEKAIQGIESNLSEEE